MKLDDLNKVFVQQLKDMYSAEKQLLEALPKMAKAASDPELAGAFKSHLEETREHVRRLDEIFKELKFSSGGERCKAMQGLIAEGDEVLEHDAEEHGRDAALICAAQKIEHYEIATYGTLRSYAELLGKPKAERLLSQTLEEERAADQTLTIIAEGSINRAAAQR